MDTQRAHELLARERARIERGLADVKRAGEDDDPDPFDPADVAPDLLDAEVGLGHDVSVRFVRMLTTATPEPRPPALCCRA